MRRVLLNLILCLLSVFSLSAQTAVKDKITLKTGEVYVGEIVLKNSDIILLKTNDGTRFQFPLSEILKTEQIELKKNGPDIISSGKIHTGEASGNFGSMIELTGGFGNAKNSFSNPLKTQITLTVGSKRVFGKSVFLGLGAGYSVITNKSAPINFLPLYFRFQTLPIKKTAPFVAMDAGYAFSLNDAYRGGVLLCISAGLIHQITWQTRVFAGAYAGVQSFSGSLTETNALGTFTYNGKSDMKDFGIKIGLLF